MKTKIKAIFLVSIVFLISLCSNVNAQTQYYTGEKSNHERKETYLHGITEEMCTSEYWKNKAFMPIDEVLMSYNEVDELNKKIVDGSGTMVFDLETMNTFNA